MKTNKKRLIACAAISLLAAVQPAAAGREVERPETAVRLVEGRVFRVRKNRNGFRFPKKVKPSFRNTGRR
jgi:hypothetical protein